MTPISQNIELAVVSESEDRTILRGTINHHRFVAKLWPASRVRDEVSQVRTAK
jgi:hypothetical protein